MLTPLGRRLSARLFVTCALSLLVLAAAACSGSGFFRQYEYEEEVYLALAGTATVFVNASVPALVALANAAFPAGKGVRFPATTAGQKVTFTLTAATRQTFAVTVLADTAANRGQVQLAIDGKNLGAAIEGYAAKAGVHTVSLGSVYLAAGKHTFAFTVTGKNKAAMGYQSGFGQITLTP